MRINLHFHTNFLPHRARTETVYGMTTPAAAGLSSVMLIGWGIMNPVWGIVADKTSSWAHSNRCVCVCVCVARP